MKAFLLITGISGSGKSEYFKHLQSKYNFLYIDTDTQGFNYIDTRQGLNMEPTNVNFVKCFLEKYDSVAYEWEFAPIYLPIVIGLKNQGAKLFWFTCPAKAAFS